MHHELSIASAETIRVKFTELATMIRRVSLPLAGPELTDCIVDKLILAERMNVPTHGLHYYLHAIHPLLQKGQFNTGAIVTEGAVVRCEGTRGIGFLKLEQSLAETSKVAKAFGTACLLMKNPGKVGALRVFCNALMQRDQLVIITKNTAPTVGIRETKGAFFGTNPIAIGVPGTSFVYDSSMSTVATNKVRLARKYQRDFNTQVGLNSAYELTANPDAIAAKDGALLPFSAGPFWFKSFFLGIAVEAMAAMAGGRTSFRVGEHKGQRLQSEEGLMAFVVDLSACPNTAQFRSEITQLMTELQNHGLRIPGQHDFSADEAEVLLDDWKEILSL